MLSTWQLKSHQILNSTFQTNQNAIQRAFEAFEKENMGFYSE